MKILGLDFGLKKIGVAIADTQTKVAVPYDELNFEGATLECLAEIVRRENIQKIIVGLPLNLHGGEGRSCQLVKEFVRELKSLGKEIILEDERFTTKEIKQAVKYYGRAKKFVLENAAAAALILQKWLDKQSI